MQLTRTPKAPSIFAALVVFNLEKLYQNKHKTFVFRSDTICNDSAPIKHYYSLENYLQNEIEPDYGYSLATIFCNIPGIYPQKLILQRSPAVIYVDNREVLSPNLNFYSDRFLADISNQHIFSKRFVERMADSFSDMYGQIENSRTKCWNNYSNNEMRQIVSEYKIHINSPIFQQYISENSTKNQQ